MLARVSSDCVTKLCLVSSFPPRPSGGSLGQYKVVQYVISNLGLKVLQGTLSQGVNQKWVLTTPATVCTGSTSHESEVVEC